MRESNENRFAVALEFKPTLADTTAESDGSVNRTSRVGVRHGDPSDGDGVVFPGTPDRECILWEQARGQRQRGPGGGCGNAFPARTGRAESWPARRGRA